MKTKQKANNNKHTDTQTKETTAKRMFTLWDVNLISCRDQGL